MPDTYVSGDLQWAWNRFEGMISSVADITNYQPVFEDYMYRAYSEFLQDNVQYVEFRTLLMPVCKVQSQSESNEASKFKKKQVKPRFTNNQP